MKIKNINFDEVVPKFDAILAGGLSCGLGKRDGQMCVEAAICAALDLPHGDDPVCVAQSLRYYKIKINDSSNWSSPVARAAGLRRLGIMQLGTADALDEQKFAELLALRTVQRLIPALYRKVCPQFVAEISACESATDLVSAKSAANAAAAAATDAAAATAAATYADAAAYAATNAAAAAATYAAAYAAASAAAARQASNAVGTDEFLLLSIQIAEEILIEMGTPGVEWLREKGQL